jgi:hypothetical protein
MEDVGIPSSACIEEEFLPLPATMPGWGEKNFDKQEGITLLLPHITAEVCAWNPLLLLLKQS